MNNDITVIIDFNSVSCRVTNFLCDKEIKNVASMLSNLTEDVITEMIKSIMKNEILPNLNLSVKIEMAYKNLPHVGNGIFRLTSIDFRDAFFTKTKPGSMCAVKFRIEEWAIDFVDTYLSTHVMARKSTFSKDS